jgi:hypothetical protein
MLQRAMGLLAGLIAHLICREPVALLWLSDAAHLRQYAIGLDNMVMTAVAVPANDSVEMHLMRSAVDLFPPVRHFVRAARDRVIRV